MARETKLTSNRTTRKKPLKHPGDRRHVFPKKKKKKPGVMTPAFFEGSIGRHFRDSALEKRVKEAGMEVLLKEMLQSDVFIIKREGLSSLEE